MEHENYVCQICNLALEILKKPELIFRPMNRKNSVKNKRCFVIGRTNLKTGLVSIDIFTAKKREPKKISSILRVLCHEVAHHQKRPYRQYYKKRWITRSHYPGFYKQVNKNISIVSANQSLKEFFLN